MKIDLSEQSNIKTLDLKGQICPWPVIFTMKELQKMNDGEILKVTIDHLPSTLNIPAAASKEGTLTHDRKLWIDQKTLHTILCCSL